MDTTGAESMGEVRVKVKLSNAMEKLDLFVDCQRGRLIPNPAHPDQPVSKVK